MLQRKARWSHVLSAFTIITISIWLSVWNTEKRATKQNHHLAMKKFLCIAYNRTLIRRQSSYWYIFYWVAVTHASAVSNPRCRNASKWLFNFRRPSICQSSASPHVLRLSGVSKKIKDCCLYAAVSFLRNFDSVCTVLGRTMYALTSFLPLPAHPLLQSKSTSIWMHHILRLSASAQKNAYAIKNIRALWNFTKHLHPNYPELKNLTGYLHGNLNRYLHRSPPKPHQVSAPKPSGTSQATCTWTFWNRTEYLHRNPPQLHRLSGRTGTLPHLTRYLHRREPQQVSAPQPSRTSLGIYTGSPSRTSTGIWTGTLRNLTRYLLRNPPEPSGTLRNPPEPSGTLPRTWCWGCTGSHQS